MNNPITNNDNIISFLTNRTYDICCASMSLILYTPNYFWTAFFPPAFHITRYVREIYIFNFTFNRIYIPVQIYV